MFTLTAVQPCSEHSRTVPLVCSWRTTGEPSQGSEAGGWRGEVAAEWAENRGSRGEEEESHET